MKIKKLGHCCLLIEHKGVRILTDPGAYADGYEDVADIDILLITHEHSDHLHVGALGTVLENNPDVKVITNEGVGKLLDEQGVTYDLLIDGQSTTVHDLLLEAFGTTHETIYKEIGLVDNTGYFVDNKLFYPGDAFTDPGKNIPVLALPVEGPWMKISEAIDYALRVKPNVCFPVHDGRFRQDRIGANHVIPGKVLSQAGIEFVVLGEMEEKEF